MSTQKNAEMNADRFKGFADVYESARPKVPERLVTIVKKYLGTMPETVVDLGCGTGLSTTIWKNKAKKVVGIEPSDDMFRIAKTKESERVSFVQAFSNNTGLPDSFADAVICSQSFHWMEPVSTLAEVNRIIRPGGIFATIDCDWPPVTGLEAEIAYAELFEKVKKIEDENKEINDTFRRWEKSGHLSNIQNSGYYKYCREIVLENTEKCDAERFIRIAESQGSLQTILKLHPELIRFDYNRFCDKIHNCMTKSEIDISFCYRVRLGVK